MRKSVSVALSIGVFGALSLTACTAPDPCLSLAPPTDAEVAAAASGADIEREVNGVECDLEGRDWQRDYDSSSSKSKTSTSKAKTTAKKPAATSKAKRP